MVNLAVTTVGDQSALRGDRLDYVGVAPVGFAAVAEEDRAHLHHMPGVHHAGLKAVSNGDAEQKLVIDPSAPPSHEDG